MEERMDFKELAKDYYETFGFNLLPLKNKAPKMSAGGGWEKWQTEIMNVNDIDSFNWKKGINGVGAICGIKNLRCLDFDKVKDYEIVKKFVLKLGLSIEYSWVVKSGSGAGYHVWFYCDYTPLLVSPGGGEKQSDVSLSEILGGKKSFYVLKLLEYDLCDHIELRWERCQTVLPKSLHPSGNIYEFVNIRGNGLPNSEPASVSVGKLIETLKEFCALDKKPVVSSQKSEENIERKDRENNIHFDEKIIRQAAEFLKGCINNYDDYLRIGFALASIGESGRKYFLAIGKDNPKYPQDTEIELNKKYDGFMKDYRGDTTLGTFFHIAESYGWKKPIIKFWSVDENRRVKINRTRYKRFLESEGFCKYKIDSTNGTGSSYLFVRIVNNIVEEIDSVDVKEFVMNYLDKLPIEEFDGTYKADVIDALIKANNQLFTTQFLEFLNTQKIEFKKDDKDRGFFYFKNGFVEVSPHPQPLSQGARGESPHSAYTEVSADKPSPLLPQTGQTRGEGEKSCVRFYDYKKLEGHVWKRQIIKRKYGSSERRSDYEELLFNICKRDKKRYEALKSGIGYLLHTYKNPSLSKAIIFIDEKMSEGAFGRSGKGLVIKGISQVRNVVTEDGRNFNPSKNFAFQRVKADTNAIAIEDIGKKYPFERLFSIITDGIVVERKNKDEIFLPFNESPKIVISTNFTISGVDDSTIDRQFIIEFSDYYNMNHRPIDDFGKLLFDGWDESEWNDFDCFMIECLQFYLQRGLVNYERININTKKLIDETTVEFSEFSEALELNKEYDKKELYENFKKEYEDFDKLTQGKFTRWLKVFAGVKGYEIRESKSGAKRVIEFVGNPHPTLSL